MIALTFNLKFYFFGEHLMISPPRAVVEGVCLFYSDYYATTPNPKDKDKKPKQLLCPCADNPYISQSMLPVYANSWDKVSTVGSS